jgi:hypothetical protein
MASVAKPTVSERNGIDLEYREEANPFNDILQCFGIICADETTISGGNLDPSIDGFEANIGSVYFSSNGDFYKKTGNNDTDWTVFSGGGVPDGGTTGQVLKKLSNADGDADWQNEDNNIDGGIF